MRATGAQIKYFYLESGWLQVSEYFCYSADDLVKKKIILAIIRTDCEEKFGLLSL